MKAKEITPLFCAPASPLQTQLEDTDPGDAVKVQDELLGPSFLWAGMWHVEISRALDDAFVFQGCSILGAVAWTSL